jgi:hypothetical protein
MVFFFTGSLYPLIAQTTDSTTSAKSTDSTTMMNNPTMKADSTSGAATPAANMNSPMPATNMSAMPAGRDTSHGMNNNSNSNMGSMPGSNMSSNNTSMMNMSAGGATAALPVLENLIPDAVVAKAKEKFGTTLYDITCTKHGADQNAYVVRVQNNGTFSTQWIDDSGNTMQ